MQILSVHGAAYRTKLLTTDQAWRFAKCVKANIARFDPASVAVIHNSRAKGARRYYVTFAPARTERVAALVAGEQDKRLARAMEQGADYVFLADKDGGRPFWWVWNPVSGETYEVSSDGCSCPDHEYRCRHAGVACKHRLTLLARLQVEEEQTPAPARAA